MSDEHAWTVDAIAHDLDMLLFRMEQARAAADPADAEALASERATLRRELDRLLTRLKDLHHRMS